MKTHEIVFLRLFWLYFLHLQGFVRAEVELRRNRCDGEDGARDLIRGVGRQSIKAAESYRARLSCGDAIEFYRKNMMWLCCCSISFPKTMTNVMCHDFGDHLCDFETPMR